MIIMQSVKEPKHDKMVKGKILTFLQKLIEDDTANGLHIEPMQHARDKRARTGRVDQGWRAVLFRLDPAGGERAYVYAGTWEHDEAIERARNTVLGVNPVNGLVILRQEIEETSSGQPEKAYAYDAPTVATPAAVPLLERHSFRPADLINEFGFDEKLAEAACRIRDENDLLDLAADIDPWQADVLVAMAVGTALHEIKNQLALDSEATVVPEVEDDAQIIEAFKRPASKMQFAFIDGSDSGELRRVLDDGDFGAWRIFLHPEQQQYAERDRTGSFRVTGGAGTGKTVVLLHRARHLVRQNPTARIVLTTFTRALADNLRRDLERLDPTTKLAECLGEAGVLVRGVDQLAAEVRQRAGGEYVSAAEAVLGTPRETTAAPAEPDWPAAIQQSGAQLPVSLRSPAFFVGEYAQIVLPHRITTEEDYFTVGRPGRGVALDRSRRAKVWAVIEQMRKNQRIADSFGYGEVAAISAEWLRSTRTTFADHVLIDEAQDLEPAKWRLVRALAPEGPNDLFIADDAHQRIYGHPVVLKRYGIAVQGRSRRLTLNYRTTMENLRFAMGILSGDEYSDADAEPETVSGYRSARSGPVPVTRPVASDAAQLDAIAADIARWTDEGVTPETIAVLAATNASAKRVQQELAVRDVSVALLTIPRTTGGKPVVMTMHMAKGMEFSRVVIFDVSDGVFPPSFVYRGLPEEEKIDKDKQFRSLLYVAASRARDELVVTWKGAPSELLLGA